MAIFDPNHFDADTMHDLIEREDAREKDRRTMTIDFDTIRAAVQALRPDDQVVLHLANFAPLVILDPAPLAGLIGTNGLLNDLGKAVSAWLVLTGEGFTPAAIEAAKVRLAAYGIEVCDGCSAPEPNVGSWSDGRRLCGGCKLRITLARPGFVAGLEGDLSRALGGKVTIDVTDPDGLPVVPKGSA